MSKNILILTGSPRKNGNSTMLANAFAKGAESKGHKVTLFDTTQKKINACFACDTCWSKGTPCSFDDDYFNELSALLETTDMIVFSTPLYWYTFPAQLKTAIDKIYPYMVDSCLKPLKITESILLTCGIDNDPHCFDGMIESFKKINKYLNWDINNILAVNSVHAKGDIMKTDALEKAEKLGFAI